MSVTQATHIRWDDLPRERLNERLERRFATGEHLTIAQFFLAQGCEIPRHSHDSEQCTHVLQGRLRFRLGQDGAETVEVGAGEILLIPSGLPHDAEAVEDSVVADSFSPPRRDWVEQRDQYLR